MDFDFSDTTKLLLDQIGSFMDEHIYPAEKVAQEQIDASGNPHHIPEIIPELQAKAKALGFWNLFLPDNKWAAGLSVLDYAPLCELMGRSPIASRVFNCQAPDTGNAEILAQFGSQDIQERYLQPLLDGEIRSCFSMTEPGVAGSDPTGLEMRAVRDGDEYALNGEKWFTSGAINAAFAIVMAVTDPKASPYARATMIVVPTDTPGFNILRAVPVMGHVGGGGHCHIRYEDCRVPVTNRLGEEGAGFMIAQARLGPGRIHHCMRSIGMAQRAYEIMVRYANTRVAFGSTLGEKQFIQDFIALSKMEITQARLLTFYAAWKMDTVGKRGARQEISMIKVVGPNMMMRVCDRAIQVMGALGVTDETPVAAFWRGGRTLRIADGSDEVHKMVIARRELKAYT